jgi:nucleoside diphosphate kinase
MSSDFVLALELIAEDVIKKWRDFIGPTNSLTAKE